MAHHRVTQVTYASAMSTRIHEIVPVLPVRDLDRAVGFYHSLGFEVSRYEAIYAYARRDDVWLHLALTPDLDPLVGAGAVYAYVADARALAAEWGAGPPVTTDYGMIEGHVKDPDNNLIRFGSPLDAS